MCPPAPTEEAVGVLSPASLLTCLGQSYVCHRLVKRTLRLPSGSQLRRWASSLWGPPRLLPQRAGLGQAARRSRHPRISRGFWAGGNQPGFPSIPVFPIASWLLYLKLILNFLFEETK